MRSRLIFYAINKAMLRISILKILFLFLSFSVLVYCLLNLRTVEFYKQYYKLLNKTDPFICYFLDTVDKLPDIQDTVIVKDTSIFFLETSCNSYDDGTLVINARQACAVESAALMNPNRTVYLLYASPGLFYNTTQSDKIFQALTSYQNVKLLHINMDKYVEGTPVEKLWKSRKVMNGKYPLVHTSDIFRYITLWKYGGIYLDLDTMVIKNLDSFPMNFAGAQDSYSVVNGVMGFSSQGEGHQYISSCIYEVADHYNGSSWADNGPKIITSLTNRLCGSNSVSEYIGNTCQNFYIFPIQAFYPIHYAYWYVYFSPNYRGYINEVTNNSYILHVWNKLSAGRKIYPFEKVPYLDFAKKFCPQTVKNSDAYF